MNRFIYKTLLIAFTIALVFGVWLCQMPMERNNYLYEQNIKDSLIQHTPSPRVIFVSGSSLAYGLDSHRIQDSLKVNVVNYGLHAGMGLKFILDRTIKYVRRGDIVVISPEYPHLYNQMYGDPLTLSPTLYYTSYRMLDMLNVEQWKNVISGIPTTIRMNEKSEEYKDQRFASVMGFNDLGDEVGHWTLGHNVVELRHEDVKADLNDDYCKCFLRQIDELKRKGAQIVVTPPPLAERAGNDPLIHKVDSFFRRNDLTYNVPPREHILPDSMFFDTVYHLAKNGVDVFTGRIIEEIRNNNKVAIPNRPL